MKEPRVLFGFHAILARLRADPKSVVEIFLDETRHDGRIKDLAATAERAGVKVMKVPTKRLDGFYGGGRHQGVVARVEVKSLSHSLDEILEQVQGPPLLLLLDGVTDPHNLGACLRVANAAGVHAVVAPKDRAAGISAAVSKVASGAAEATPYLMVTNLARTIDELKEREIWVVGTDERADRLEEQRGLRRHGAHHRPLRDEIAERVEGHALFLELLGHVGDADRVAQIRLVRSVHHHRVVVANAGKWRFGDRPIREFLEHAGEHWLASFAVFLLSTEAP